MLKQLLKPLASLRLTVVLLVLSMILIYAGTWAQIDTGIWQVQKKYFHSLFVWIDLATFLPRPGPTGWRLRGGFPMPGGYLIGLMLLINLLAAHFVRFKMTWKRTGVVLIHLGLILLLVGEGITSALAIESQMTIDEGGWARYSQDIREVELAIMDASSPDHDQVAAIDGSQLKTGATITHAALPVQVKVDRYFANSGILGPMQAGSRADARATAGTGVGITVVDEAPTGGMESTIDFPAAYVTLTAAQGGSLGTYLVSAMPMEMPGRGMLDAPQEIQINGKPYKIALRFKRFYKPYTIHLLDFSHGKYLGTSIDKDFASHIRLEDPTRNVDREVRIWMNNPLRYHGETFYQSGFKPGDKTTVLQIVSNPAWTMPYIACTVGALGLVLHFGITLLSFVGKKLNQRVTTGPAWTSPLTIGAVVVVGVIYVTGLLAILKPGDQPQAFDYKSFGTLPVTFEGRVQPLDSLARNALKIIGGRDSARVDGKSMPAVQWLADMFARPDKATDYQVIRIDHPELLGLLNLDTSRKRFSLRELLASQDTLNDQINRVRKVESHARDLFQRKILELDEKIGTYIQLAEVETLLLVPPLSPGEKWQSLGDTAKSNHPGSQPYLKLINDYHDEKADAFASDLTAYHAQLNEKLPEQRKVEFEAAFNHFDPFMQCITLYITAFVLVFLSWLFWGVHLRRAAAIAVIIAMVIHTGGLIARIYISGRPPVTNLASSAIFIAYGAVLLSMGLEFFFRNGIGTACAAMIGFLSLLIADRLALTGDTLKVLVAVLDTNFWLATHVVMITLGYAATFLAGFLGIIYVLRGLFTRSMDREAGKDLIRMIYGIVCFATLFSFVGTILGGIWADQSWGRFWGWDPKENGAVLIVLANALLLHARWGGLVKDRGVACLAIFGNIVTAWSWFGVNMLGVGLHSYGFMDSALQWLLLFVASQLFLILLANVPQTWWRSYTLLTATPIARPRSIPTAATA